MKLSFHVTGDTNSTLEVLLDAEGRDLLIRLLQKIKEPGDHDHLMTPAWGGHELTEEVLEVSILVHQVNIGIMR
jgi:hypothetical protein